MKKLAIAALVVIIGYHAAAGVACLYMTAPVITNRDDCDAVSEQNGRKWCMNLITEQPAGKILPEEGK